VQGIVSKQHIFRMFKVDADTIGPILDLLAAQQLIILSDDVMATDF
jgi:hypothetical protein